MNPTFDPIGLIERAYQTQTDEAGWASEMAGPLGQFIDPDDIGILHYTFEAGKAYGSTPEWFPGTRALFRCAGEAAEFGETVFRSLPAATVRLMQADFQRPGLNHLRARVELEMLQLNRLGVQDAAAICIQGQRAMVLFTTLLRQRLQVDEAVLHLWRYITAHLGAALRMCTTEDNASSSQVDCVLAPSGDVVHARATAVNTCTLQQLRSAVRDMERARTRRCRTDPLAALELWRGLYSGMWSLVDHFDSDGRRYVVARRNPPAGYAGLNLPLRQRQVLFFIAAGWSNKEVAYALGISAATVAVHLHRALSRMGVASREDWSRISCVTAAAASMVCRSGGDSLHHHDSRLPADR